jgi:phosphopantetheine--protein transferase-like protein
MIAGCGVDLVRVDRLDRWQHFADKQLARVFLAPEVAAIRAGLTWSSQRAAAYFALKEAFYKALSNALVATGQLQRELYFNQVCPLVCVQKNRWGIPQLVVDWEKIAHRTQIARSWQVHCSYAHEGEFAVAYVILS